MGNVLVCAKCKQRIVGVGNKAYGKVYCATCYEEIMKQAQQAENNKNDLINYICKLFSITECPSEVTYAVDTAIKNGMKISGLKGTLYYYYEISGHPTNNVHLINYVFKTQYDNAKKYFAEQKEIKKRNEEVMIPKEPIHIKLDVTKLRNRNKQNQIPYKIEDL